MKLKNKLRSAMLATASFAVAFFITVSVAVASAFGGDYSKYQPNLFNNTGQDTFAITQMGGSQNGYIYDQYTYSSHVRQGLSRGWHVHNYIWMQTGSNQYQTQQMLNYFLPKVQTPKGSIVALDYEAGASGNVEANTNNILYGMRRIKAAGYTPMLYSYKPYLNAHVDVARVLAEFPNSLWVAGYQSGLSVSPNYAYFPSMNGVAIWQYSDYGGQQDLNVDLLGITNNGYTKNTNPQITQPVQQPKVTTPKSNNSNGVYVVKSGDSFWSIANKYNMSMYTLAANNGLSINSVIYPGQTLKVAGQAKAQTSKTSSVYTVKSGDSFWSIAQRYGMNMYTLASNNGLSINSTIYPGQQLKVNGSNASQKYTVQTGDSFWSIGQKFGKSMYTIASNNGLSINSIIYPGQTLTI